MAFALTGCQSFQDYQKARAQMTSAVADLKDILKDAEAGAPNGKVELEKDHYLLGKLINGIGSYKIQLQLAAEASSEILSEARKAKEKERKKQIVIDPALLAQLRANFNQEAYDSFYDELSELQLIVDRVQYVCLRDPYTRNCTTWGRLVVPLVSHAQLLRQNLVELMAL
jgi:hypothetical protein